MSYLNIAVWRYDILFRGVEINNGIERQLILVWLISPPRVRGVLERKALQVSAKANFSMDLVWGSGPYWEDA